MINGTILMNIYQNRKRCIIKSFHINDITAKHAASVYVNRSKTIFLKLH